MASINSCGTHDDGHSHSQCRCFIRHDRASLILCFGVPLIGKLLPTVAEALYGPLKGVQPMQDMAIAEAKEQLAQLIERAQRGEDVRITAPAIGTVRLQPVPATDFVPLAENRVLGHLAGKTKVPARLMEPMSEEELRDWYGDD
jgi:antitoxin (DNA-binding transcriptional repressor) of toxin-antitoxin stability system